MNLHNLFEDDNSTPNPNYAEELAYQIFKVAPELDTTGAADEVLDYAFDLAVNDLGRKRAHALFSYDEDFDSDLVNAYLDLQMNKPAVDEGGPYDLPGIDYPRPGDTPAKPRYRGQSSPGVIPDDEDYFREIFRKKREAAKKAERDADHDRLATGTNEGQQWPDSSNSLAKRSAVATNLKGAPSKAGRTSGMTVATRVDPTITSTKVQRKDDRPIPSFLQKSAAEGSVLEFAEKPEDGPGSDEYEDLLFHLAWEIWSEAGDSAQAERKLSLLGWKPEFGDDYTAIVLYKIGSNDHRQYTIDEFEDYGQQDVTEADKKKEDELGTEVRDVSLQRAIARAKSDFPTAGSGIEALAKDLMRGQEQDKQDFEKIRAVDKDQERMLAQIAQVDQNQTQEIDNLEQDNTTLKRRLQQIQSVNAKLEKTLASMSGRKKEKTTPADTSVNTFSPTASIPDAPAPATATSKTKTKSKTKAKSQPAKSSTKPVTRQIASPNPGAHAFSKMAPALSTADNPQASLFPSDYGQDSVNLAMQQIRKNALAGKNAGAQDVSFRDVMDPGSKSVERVARDDFGVQENNGQEAKYSDKYQDMVARVGQKAREQEKSKPVDIKDLARRLAAIDAKDKSAR